MDDITARLRDIFATVLELEPDSVTSALSPQSCAKWDSLQHIHIVNAIEEEFGIGLDFQQQLDLTSFQRAVEIVNGHKLPGGE